MTSMEAQGWRGLKFESFAICPEDVLIRVQERHRSILRQLLGHLLPLPSSIATHVRKEMYSGLEK